MIGNLSEWDNGRKGPDEGGARRIIDEMAEKRNPE
jgi:hypothetical protein